MRLLSPLGRIRGHGTTHGMCRRRIDRQEADVNAQWNKRDS
jgi:hypothetical protein